jgi:hypothetical protein
MSIEKFAKLFETADYGQVAVMLQMNEEDSAPKLSFICRTNLGLCSLDVIFENNEIGWADAAKALANTDEAAAIAAAQQVHNSAALAKQEAERPDTTPLCVRDRLDKPGVYRLLLEKRNAVILLEIDDQRRVHQLNPKTLERDGILSPQRWTLGFTEGFLVPFEKTTPLEKK